MSSPALKIEPAPKAPEPSMEEILASIRRIIADDDSRPAQKPAPPPPPAAEPEPPARQDDIDALFESEEAALPADVLELTEEMAAPSEPIGGTDLDFIDAELPTGLPEEEPADPAPAPAPRMSMAEPARQAAPPPPPRQEDRLLSSATDTAISAAFGNLTHTILSQNARTLDDLVQDMLRPMLKTWLDDNLPALVERLVRAEIERVSRGGR
jgi:uncharacterized protein